MTQAELFDGWCWVCGRRGKHRYPAGHVYIWACGNSRHRQSVGQRASWARRAAGLPGKLSQYRRMHYLLFLKTVEYSERAHRLPASLAPESPVGQP